MFFLKFLFNAVVIEKFVRLDERKEYLVKHVVLFLVIIRLTDTVHKLNLACMIPFIVVTFCLSVLSSRV